jgi:hypothetical protein
MIITEMMRRRRRRRKRRENELQCIFCNKKDRGL